MRIHSFAVGVIGGGFTGVAGAIACLARIKTPFRLVLVEPARRSDTASRLVATIPCTS